MKFRDFLNEAEQEHVIYVKSNYPELWITYAQGSGQTIQLPNLNKYLTNKQGDSNYEASVGKLVKWSKTAKTMKKSGNSKLFEIPQYPMAKMGEKYDIFGGDIKPTKKIYMVIDDNGKIVVVNFFESKNEATAWIKSVSD